MATIRIIEGYTPLADLARDLKMENGSIHNVVTRNKFTNKWDIIPTAGNPPQMRKQRLVYMEEVPRIYEILGREVPKAWAETYARYNDPTVREHQTMVEQVQDAFEKGGQALINVCQRYHITEIGITQNGLRIKRLTPEMVEIPLE